jgi:hypothetical protein
LNFVSPFLFELSNWTGPSLILERRIRWAERGVAVGGNAATERARRREKEWSAVAMRRFRPDWGLRRWW